MYIQSKSLVYTLTRFDIKNYLTCTGDGWWQEPLQLPDINEPLPGKRTRDQGRDPEGFSQSWMAH